MNVLDAIASATQIVSSMMLAVGALEQASRDMHEAPGRIEALEAFVCDLDNLTRLIKQKHAQRMHNTRLEHQVRSLNALVERLHHNLFKAKKMVTKNKAKRMARVMWSSIVGDPISRLTQLVRDDLNRWLELQTLTDSVGQVVLSTAKSVPSLLRVNFEHGYPVPSKSTYVRSLLERDDTHRVILIVGLSGIGKSCLARHIAADPPSRFLDGAAELSFGQGCTLSACNNNRIEYHKRLTKRISMLLVKIGLNVKNEFSDLEDVCCALQTALVGKSILILLDDVWEQDIVERFVKLYDNDCKYLVTTRNEAIYEITEAEKVEICKDDMREISKEILLYHSVLTIEELPSVAESLLDRCGHHPLTLAVMGKALRKEMRTEKWDKAILNLSTYATSWPGPISYVNEKEVENTLTIFRSFEISLEAMPEECQTFFTVLSAIAWTEPVPEACLEALWSVLGDENVFSLVVCKLVEGSLLIKHDSTLLFHVHDMVSLYLDIKANEAIQRLLKESSLDSAASIAPWIFIFGKESAQLVAESKMNSFLSDMQEPLIMIILRNAINALMASKSISELEASRRSFHRLLGPRVTELILTGSDDQVIATSEAINFIFDQEDYYEFAQSVEDQGALNRLINLCLDCEDASSRTIISALISRLAEYGSTSTADIVLAAIPMNQLSELLSPYNEDWHESIFKTLMSLIKVGKSDAVERMISAGVDEKLLILLESSSEVVQHYSIVILKSFHELGFPFRSGTLDLLPWHARLSLERFIGSDRCTISSPTPQPFQDILQKLIERDTKEVMKAIQDLLPIIEKASDPRIQDMILESQLFERLAFLLQHGDSEQDQVKSECAFLVMKLACVGGKLFVQKFFEYDIVNVLLKMMHGNNEGLQDSAYIALHQIVSGRGGTQIVNQFLEANIIEKLVNFLDHKLRKTKEVTMLLLVDLVEVGNKPCIEKMFSSQVIEKLVNMEKSGGKFSGSIVKFLKGLDMCKNISSAERQVMKQQVCSEVKKAVKSPKLQARLIASIEASISEGSKGSSSGKHRR